MTADVPELTPSEIVLRIAGGRPALPVWRNTLGMVTWQVGTGDSREFVKDGWRHRDFEAADDAERLEWLAQFVPVPMVLGHGASEGGGLWLHTAGLPGSSAVSPLHRQRPRPTARGLGAALRRFHDEVPVDECPFSWSAESRIDDLLADARLSEDIPSEDDLVVCHGDACSPNFLFDDDTALTGYVDVGCCGVADRHADLAPALLSLGWNFGAGFSEEFLAGYGLPEPDYAKLDWYTRLWQAD